MLRHDRQGRQGRRVRSVPEDLRERRGEKRREQRVQGRPECLGTPMSRPAVGFFDREIEDYEGFLSDPATPAIARELTLREAPVKMDPSPSTAADVRGA